MSTTDQREEFANLVSQEIRIDASLGHAVLDSAIKYIADNFTPEDVFDEKKLQTWAENNGYIKQ